MSRYTEQFDAHCLSYGWDQPLDTFFAVLAPQSDDKGTQPLFELGVSRHEYADLTWFNTALLANMDEQGIPFRLTDDQILQLTADQVNNPNDQWQGAQNPTVVALLEEFQRSFQP